MQINGHSPFLEMKTCNWETDVMCATLVLYIWVGSRNCGCLVAWFCYQLMARPGSKTVAVPWPDSYVFIVYMTQRLSVCNIYGNTNDALILVTSYWHIHFSYVHECIFTALYCAVFVLLMQVFLWLSLLLLLYIVRNDENKDSQSIRVLTPGFNKLGKQLQDETKYIWLFWFVAPYTRCLTVWMIKHMHMHRNELLHLCIDIDRLTSKYIPDWINMQIQLNNIFSRSKTTTTHNPKNSQYCTTIFIYIVSLQRQLHWSVCKHDSIRFCIYA